MFWKNRILRGYDILMNGVRIARWLNRWFQKINLSDSKGLPIWRQAVERCMLDKATGGTARHREDEAVQRAGEKCARLFSARADEITFLSSASEDINNVVYGLEWKPGGNVVVCDVEFPSGVYP